MTGIALAIALAALPICEDPLAQAAKLQSAAGTPGLETAIASAELELGQPLLLPDEASSLPLRRAQLAARRLPEACALLRDGRVAATPDRARLAAILDRPELANARRRSSGALALLLSRLWDWLYSLLGTSEAGSFSRAARTAVLAGALAVVIGGALRLLRARLRRPRPAAAKPHADRLKLEDPLEHLSRARAALGADAREAIRQGLFCLLSALEKRRLARPDRVKTNRELAAELPVRGATPELHAEVSELLRWYDRTFYSLEPVAAAEAARFVDDVGRLRQLLGESAA
ncbi:MAG: DUF4129 domain-containing protein [Myxococcales bacterium]|nr:DUF4129 domain-containing protein [Myxococcales bacterium]